jgi:hypothetical protein
MTPFQVLFGNGDGTFAADPPTPGIIGAVADFNGDGKPDLLEGGSNGTPAQTYTATVAATSGNLTHNANAASGCSIEQTGAKARRVYSWFFSTSFESCAAFSGFPQFL